MIEASQEEPKQSASTEKPVKITQILEDFSTSLIILKKRAIAEMKTREDKLKLA